VLNQLSIVIGILCGQCASLGLARIRAWRYIMVVSAFVAALQLLISSRMPESPVWLRSQSEPGHQDSAEESLPSPEGTATLSHDVEKVKTWLTQCLICRTKTTWRKYDRASKRDSWPGSNLDVGCLAITSNSKGHPNSPHYASRSTSFRHQRRQVVHRL